MELRHLRYFMAVAEFESVRLASEHLHITQPAISRQIQDLEDELGFLLFERSPRGLKVTLAGDSYLRDVRKVMAALDSAAEVAKRVAVGVRGQLRLGYVENAGWDGLVPKTFSRFQAEVPEVKIELTALNSPQQLRAIADETLDGGFIYQYGPLSGEFTTIPLLEYNVVLAVPRAWDIDHDETLPIDLRSLADRPFVMFPRMAYPTYYDRLIGAFQQSGIHLNVVQEETTEAAILSLVCSGIGAAVVNSANLGRPPAQVRFFRLNDLSIPMPLTFAHRSDASNPVLSRFLSVLHATLGDMQKASPTP
ncbi:LysR family transcriptional regulator [Cupriavidus necator]|uniref:LysR family transcriptional regulator n=1 Tax=Cupriavidus necator TaxID=106590 RepID=UPI00339D5FD8